MAMIRTRILGSLAASVFAGSATVFAFAAWQVGAVYGHQGWEILFWACAAASWIGVYGWVRARYPLATVGAWLAVVGNFWMSALVVLPVLVAVWTTTAAPGHRSTDPSPRRDP